MLGKNARGDLVQLTNVVEDGVLKNILACLTELEESHETRVGLAEDSVAVTRNDLALVESRPDELDDLLVRGALADLLRHAEDETEHFLVGKTVKRSSKTTEGSRVGKEGVGQSRTDQVSGVSRDVATLVIGVEGVVKTDEVNETLRFAETDLVGKVEREILVLLDSGHVLGTIEVGVAVDACIAVCQAMFRSRTGPNTHGQRW